MKSTGMQDKEGNGMIIHERDREQTMRGNVHLDVWKNGEIIETDEDHNLIVKAGRNKLARLLGGDYGGHITKVGVGTGSAAAADSDTDLTNKVLLDIDSTSYDSEKVTFNFTIGTGQANGLLIRELGLFFADGTIFSRRVRKSIIGKEDDIKITGYWEIYL